MATVSPVKEEHGIKKKALKRKLLGEVSATCGEQINEKHSHVTKDQVNRETKKKKKKKKQTKEKKTGLNTKKTESNHITRFPQKATDYSANWKKLLEVLPQKQKSGTSTDLKSSKSGSKKGLQNYKSNSRTDSDKKDVSHKIWFDGVDESLLLSTLQPSSLGVKKTRNTDSLVKPNSSKGLTKSVAIDCEMVGVGTGEDSILARVSLVNQFGNCIYDKYVKPTENVSDYRTPISGIRPENIEKGENFEVVQKEVNDIIKGRILVGHAVENDLKVLFLSYPSHRIRDTSCYKPFKALYGGKTPSLKRLTAKLLGVQIQEGEHSSIQDAQAAMRLYTMFKRSWECTVRSKNRWRHSKSSKKKQKNHASSKTEIQPDDNFVTE